MDEQLTAQDARYPVYQWIHKPDWPMRAKFEQFLRDMKDLNSDGYSGSGKLVLAGKFKVYIYIYILEFFCFI